MADEHVRLSGPQTTPGHPPARGGEVAPARGPHDNHQAADQTQTRPAADQAGSLLARVRSVVWPKSPTHAPRQTESFREIVETVVFVVVLVLLLKSFVAEAFVIPTGSMADTLLGYQKWITCPQCKHEFPLNCSHEVDPQDGRQRVEVTECTCPNCRLPIRLIDPRRDGRQPNALAGEILDPGWNSGDRVLVVKYVFDLLPGKPERWQVVVFKFPGDDSFPTRGPQQNWIQMNYIKRLIGLGHETIGIWYGDLYKKDGEEPPDLAGVPVTERWKKDYTGDVPDTDPRLRDENHPHAAVVRSMRERMHTATEQLKASDPRFQILQKAPDKILAMMRLVYNNDQPAQDLEKAGFPPRWAGVDDRGAWTKADAHGFRHVSADGERLHWLRYRHLLRGHSDRPELITDFLGYNTYRPRSLGDAAGPNWVGDLILECEAVVDDSKGELVLELSKGVDRFRARWDLASGQCKLFRTKWPRDGDQPLADDDFMEIGPVGGASTLLKGKGTYRLRFANVDQRLTVWVDGRLPFGDGVSYEPPPPKKRGPYANDLEPASIAVKGGMVSVRHLKLWRDTYYTTRPGGADGSPEGGDWSDPKRWDSLRSLDAKTLYVQPGHYLCLGDNSPESSDGRSWGTVPERLMLGRALAVYYPFYFPYWPLKAPVNRVGAIE